MRIVIAIGGNALLECDRRPRAAIQRADAVRAAAALAPLADEHEVVVAHGNGPRAGMPGSTTADLPLDVLGAQAQGMIGYWLLQALQNALPGRPVATVLDQTLVSLADPAFAAPATFVGPVYSREEAAALAAERGWSVAADGASWRRVVPSPQPQRVVEARVVRLLLGSGAVVVCGGGGVPVVRNESGRLTGVEAVVDRDLATAVLAEELDADALLMLTDVPAVQRRFGGPDPETILRASPAELRRESFAAGSMGPKVEAACRFVELTGGLAGIGALADAPLLLAGKAGTVVTPGGDYGGPHDLRPPH